MAHIKSDDSKSLSVLGINMSVSCICSDTF